MALHKITPEILTQYVNFFYGKVDWIYQENGVSDMYKLQAEGASKIWNLLLEKEIALLADEVGMGKTIQALAAVVTLWLQKPDAKILLYAPNENVAKKWVNEYKNFINYHYRHSDEKVKSAINGSPARNAIYVENHAELLQQWNKKWPSFLIGKISSLSNFNSSKLSQKLIDSLKINLTRPLVIEENDENKAEWMKWMKSLGVKSNDYAYKQLSKNDEPPIDLLIIDEAHYLRRTDSPTNRSEVARALFNHQTDDNRNSDSKPLAKRVLLLTATPNHSGSSDINNIIGLFKPSYFRKSPEEILSELCVRRYRRLQGKTKHQYRHEIPEPVKLETIREKLFFAAYQKSLVEYQSSNKEQVRHNNPYRILFGFLEGFEFLSQDNTREWINKNKKKDKINTENSESFTVKEDTELIRELSKIYYQSYKERPKHAKYDSLIEQLSPKSAKYAVDKRLVFVRRIPSVFEISTRLIEDYDDWLFQFIKPFLKREQRKKALKRLSLRKEFRPSRKEDELELSDYKISTNDSVKEEEISDVIPFSKVLDLFTIKKPKPKQILKYKSTDCSNFRLRFTSPNQIFSIFFQPASDYKFGMYKLDFIFSNKEKRVFKSGAIYERINKVKNKAHRNKLLNAYQLNEPDEIGKGSDEELPTLFTLWWNSDTSDDKIRSISEKSKLMYQDWTQFEKEGFSNYLERGLLHASPFIVMFYSYYRIVNKSSTLKGENLYLKFCEVVKNTMIDSGLFELISNAVLTFNLFYKKECAINEEDLIYENWNFLNFTIPVYPYCASTQRRSIIQAFNTPFFPNVLVATSVLQEGVDLHYQCNNVVHYGIAWTPGDNEQRVGRVDRMFGKLDTELGENSKTQLPIHYPYLDKTLDQIQLAQFIQKKSNSEEMIDRFKNITITKEINLQQSIGAGDDKEWHKLFKTPQEDCDLNDPFGVNNSDFSGIIDDEFNIDFGFKSFVPELLNTLNSIYQDELSVLIEEEGFLSSETFAALRHIRENGRHQPVLFSVEYFEPGIEITGSPVYCLSIKTPLGKRIEGFDNFTHYGLLKNVYQEYPAIKICLDETRKKSEFRLYCRVDLVILYGQKQELNISKNELKFWVDKLIQFSDDLEEKITGRDINNEDIISIKGRNIKHGAELSADRGNELQTRKWLTNADGTILFRSEPENKQVSLLDTFEFNHHNKFVRQINLSQITYRQVAIFKNDALQSEYHFYDSLLRLKLF